MESHWWSSRWTLWHNSLLNLGLGHCRGITNKNLHKLIPNKTITTLSLQGTWISKETCTLLTKMRQLKKLWVDIESPVSLNRTRKARSHLYSFTEPSADNDSIQILKSAFPDLKLLGRYRPYFGILLANERGRQTATSLVKGSLIQGESTVDCPQRRSLADKW